MSHISAKIGRGQFLRREDGTWQVLLVKAKVLQLRNIDTGEVDKLPMDQWYEDCLNGTVEMVSDPAVHLPEPARAIMYTPLFDLPPKMRYSAERKAFYVDAYHNPVRFYETHLPDVPPDQRILPRGKSKKVLERFLVVVRDVFVQETEEKYRALFRMVGDGSLPLDFRKTPPFSTWCRWASLDDAAGGNKRALASRFDLRGPCARVMNVRVENELNGLIDEIYLTRSGKRSAKDVWEALKKWVADWNRQHPLLPLTYPSQRHVQRYIHEAVDPYIIDCRRHGQDYADHKWKQVGRGVQPDTILEIVEVDHTRGDILVCDDITRKKLGRPWITVALCRKSKVPVGVHIHFDGQTMAAVFQCLKNAMLPKDFLREFGIEIDFRYPCGRPVAFLFDRGPDFDNEHTQSIGAELTIRIDYSPGECPEYKGSVERFLRTLQEDAVHPLPGAVPPFKLNEVGRTDDGEVFITFSAFRQRVWHWLANVYLQSIHRSLGDTPLNVWQHHAENYLHRPPPRKDDLDTILARRLFLKPTRKGVAWNHLRWFGDSIERIMRNPDFKKGDSVIVRIDDNDVSRAWVTDPHTLTRHFLQPIDPEYMIGLTLYQHRMCVLMDNERRKLVEQDNEPRLLEAKIALMDQARELLNGGANGRTIAPVARFMGIGSIAPQGDDPADNIDLVRDRPVVIEADIDMPFDDLDELVPPDDRRRAPRRVTRVRNK